MSSKNIIYLLVFLTVAIPIWLNLSVRPIKMKAAGKMYQLIENLPQDKLAILSLDYTPSTIAENEPQFEVLFEHLLRKKIPVVLMTTIPLASPFLRSSSDKVFTRLAAENLNFKYGTDYIILGYRPARHLFFQALSKSSDITRFLNNDVNGTSLDGYPIFKNKNTIKDISFVANITGLVGVFDSFVQFLTTEDYKPFLGHGCTSITIPDAYIYLDSGQLSGLLEGVSGASWYSKLLDDKYPQRLTDGSKAINTALGFAQGLILFLILIGNLYHKSK